MQIVLNWQNFERWSLNLIALYGHHQLRNVPNYVSQVRVLQLADRNLSWVDLAHFVSLEVVDLSSNRLKVVGGM